MTNEEIFAEVFAPIPLKEAGTNGCGNCEWYERGRRLRKLLPDDKERRVRLWHSILPSSSTSPDKTYLD